MKIAYYCLWPDVTSAPLALNNDKLVITLEILATRSRYVYTKGDYTMKNMTRI